jgi:thioredoxin reductase
VTVVCAAFEPSMTQDFSNSEQLYRRLPHKGVRFVRTTEVTGVRPGEAEVRNVYSQQASSLPADSVVVSLGGVADDSLYAQLASRRPNVYGVGDCVAPRDMAGAISDGMRVMQNITVAAPA